jgi:hypothetical protein
MQQVVIENPVINSPFEEPARHFRFRRDSDIDLAIFLNKEEIDGFDECRLLMKLRWDVDLSIEPHCFAKSDFDETNPYIKEIIKTGLRIL